MGKVKFLFLKSFLLVLTKLVRSQVLSHPATRDGTCERKLVKHQKVSKYYEGDCRLKNTIKMRTKQELH